MSGNSTTLASQTSHESTFLVYDFISPEKKLQVYMAFEQQTIILNSGSVKHEISQFTKLFNLLIYGVGT